MKKALFWAVLLVAIGITYLTHPLFAQATSGTATVPVPSADPNSVTGIFGVAGGLALAINFIVGALKNWAKFPAGWCPAAAFILGAISGPIVFLIHLAPVGMTLPECVLAGIALGGTATGLYEVKKNSTEAIYGNTAAKS